MTSTSLLQATVRGGGPARPRSLASGSVVNLVGGAASAVATFAVALVLTRTLPVEVVGAVFATTSLFLVVTSFGRLGTSTGLVYFVARAHHDERPLAPYLRAAAWPLLVLAVASSIALLWLAPSIAAWMGDANGPELTPSLRVLALVLVFPALLEFYGAATRGLGAMAPTALLDQTFRPLLQLGLVAIAVPSGDPTLVVAAWALPYVPAAFAAGAWWRRLRPAEPASEPAEPVWPRYWRFTTPRVFASVGQVIMQRFDIVLVGALAGLAEAAIYAAATRFLVPGQVAGRAIGRAVQPGLARALGSGKLTRAEAMYRTATGWLVLLVWPLYLVLALSAHQLVPWVFGSSYAPGAGVLVLLSATMLVATGCGMVDVVLTMGGRTGWNLANVALAFAVNLGLDLWLIPEHGLWGAGIGWAAGILCANLVPLVQVRLFLGLHPFGRATLSAMALGLACFLALPLLARPISGGWDWAPLASLAVTGPLYAALVWRLRGSLHLRPTRTGSRPAASESVT